MKSVAQRRRKNRYFFESRFCVRSDPNVTKEDRAAYRNIPMECANSQNRIDRPSDENRAESHFLCFETPIRLWPFLDRIQTALNNQFICGSLGPSVAGAPNYSQSSRAQRRRCRIQLWSTGAGDR